MTKGSPLSGPVGQIVAAHLGDLRDLLNSHGITNARLFGSVARGDDREGSDVDILIDVPEGTSLFDLAHIQRELEALLGLKVDLGTEVKARLRERIEAEAIPLDGLDRPGEIPQGFRRRSVRGRNQPSSTDDRNPRFRRSDPVFPS